MQLTVTVSDDIAHEARTRGLPVAEFVESLIDKGIRAAQGRPELAAAHARPAVCSARPQSVATNRPRSELPRFQLGGRYSSHTVRLVRLQS
jgi:hypothetical protein